MTVAPPLAPAGTRDWSLWTVDARLVVTDATLLDRAHDIVTAVTAEVDRVANRFRPDSLVRRLAVTGADATTLDPVLAALLREALAAAELTGGDVDPTLGHPMQASGYDEHVARLGAGAAGRVVVQVARRPSWRAIALEGDRLTMPKGTLLDLGATAKALAADWSARAVAAELGCGVLVSLGGDLATAGSTPEGGWQVAARDTDDDPGQVVTLHDGHAVATSSTQRRRWTSSGQAAHHILDPRTLTPAPVVWRSVSVVADTCVTANVLATASVVRGRPALRWLAGQGVAARLVDRAGHVHRVGGWPAAPLDPRGASSPLP